MATFFAIPAAETAGGLAEERLRKGLAQLASTMHNMAENRNSPSVEKACVVLDELVNGLDEILDASHQRGSDNRNII